MSWDPKCAIAIVADNDNDDDDDDGNIDFCGGWEVGKRRSKISCKAARGNNTGIISTAQ